MLGLATRKVDIRRLAVPSKRWENVVREEKRSKNVGMRWLHGSRRVRMPETKESSGEGSGFQSSRPWRQSSPIGNSKQIDMSATWRQYANSMVETFLMIGCIGFAFAASIRAGHHQSVHDEDMEAMNYELIETEEELERIKENWARINEILKKEAVSHSKSGLVIPIQRVEDLINQSLFSNLNESSKVEQEPTVEESNLSAIPSYLPNPTLPGPSSLVPLPNTRRIILF